MEKRSRNTLILIIIKYHPQKDQINTLDRRTGAAIFRLRTGHCGLRNISRDWIVLIQSIVNVAVTSKLLGPVSWRPTTVKRFVE